jgi:hypothetical protein
MLSPSASLVQRKRILWRANTRATGPLLTSFLLGASLTPGSYPLYCSQSTTILLPAHRPGGQSSIAQVASIQPSIACPSSALQRSRPDSAHPPAPASPPDPATAPLPAVSFPPAQRYTECTSRTIQDNRSALYPAASLRPNRRGKCARMAVPQYYWQRYTNVL